ncbi:MAG: PQQ-binding-like beta-propeller repeat protein, partial [bacterium]
WLFPDSATSFAGTGASVVNNRLTNASGFSAELDAVLDPIFPTAATAHPYVLHFADYGAGNYDPATPTGFTTVTTPPPSGHLVMAMGAPYDFREYQLSLSGAPVEFAFAVACSYGLSVTNRLQRFSPEYRLPQYNKKAASEIETSVPVNALAAGILKSSATLRIDVVDPSHNIAVGPGLDQMLSDSSVSTVTIDCPGVLSSPITLLGSGAIPGSGHDPLDPLRFETLIMNETTAPEGSYPGLVRVLDSYTPGQNTAPLLAGNDGLGRVPPGASPLDGLTGITQFATYQTFTLVVGPAGSTPPLWPVLMGNSAHTGAPGLAGPTQVFTAPSWTSGCSEWNCYGNPLPVFLDSTTAYFSNTGDGGSLPAQAVDLATRTVKWHKIFNDLPQNWLNVKGISIASDGHTYVLCHENKTGNLYGLDGADGSIAWHLTTTDALNSDTYVTTDLDGNFICQFASNLSGPDGRFGVASLDPITGAEHWFTPTSDSWYGAPAVGANGRIYAGVDRSNFVLHALDPANGDILWSTPGLGEQRGNAVTVHPDGDILVHVLGGLYCFTDQGATVMQHWTQPYPCPFYSSMGVGPSGDIFEVCYDGILRRIDPGTGNTVAFSTFNFADGYAARPAIASDGTLYFGGRTVADNQAWWWAVNPDCTVKWSWNPGTWFGSGITGAGALGQDGTLYTSYRTLGLVAWKDS